ncbi:MAG TPA: hypothetical protein VFX20_17970 [Steroidobacteraceae bacterium]|nr:hypothetical protein [Steroidobacteraceae bacterium]
MNLLQLLALGIEIFEEERGVIVYSYADKRGHITDREALRWLRKYDRFLKHARLTSVALIRAAKARQRAAKPRRSR